MKGPKILIVDIETAELIVKTWGIRDQYIDHTRILEDWSIIAWSAKWYKGPDGTVYGPHDKIIYQDNRKSRKFRDDKKILKKIYSLIDEADVVVGQNSRAFDVKKLNARFLINGINGGKPPTPFIQHDTKVIAFKHFGFTSAKLEYLANALRLKHRKLTKRQFSGNELWDGCEAGNKVAWNEMKDYNQADVLTTEELYTKFLPWGVTTNYNVFRDDDTACNCGSKNIHSHGVRTTLSGRYRRYRCNDCGATFQDSKNLLKPSQFKKRVV